MDNIYQEFDHYMKMLVGANAEAKDNSKFLNTLERQFKILQSGDLASIEQCLSSLLNGLRLVFIISRYYKQDEKMSKLLTIISNEICDRVREKVNIRELLKPHPDTIYEDQLEQANATIFQGITVLNQWVELFLQTKEQLELDGGDRWDFTTLEIRGRPTNMMNMLRSFEKITMQLRKLLALLGPKLKSVTGSTDNIDSLVKKSKTLVDVFDNHTYDFFAKENQDRVQQLLNRFNSDSEAIQREATSLIEETFKNLRSSESGFEFLLKFKVDSLDDVSRDLTTRYGDVLSNYKKELDLNKRIYEEGKSKHVLTKNKPPVAGAIAWKKSIMRRVKAPIVRFVEKESTMFERLKPELDRCKEEYKQFFDELDRFQEREYKNWSVNVNELASSFLKIPILSKTETEGEVVYSVNFPTRFRVLINEAKYLDRMVPNVAKKILNIALQEGEYYRYIDKVEKMLREYRNTVNSLKDVEKNLLSGSLEVLRKQLDPGAESYYLNSLGIHDFIENCEKEIKRFNDKKNKVEEKTRNIEDIIRTIEEAKIFKDYDFLSLSKKQKEKELQNYPTLQEFVNYFEKFLQTEVESLADKYMKIGNAMLPQIAFAIFDINGNADKLPQMRYYYYYWERRVYNSLVKMIVKALLTYKALLKRPRKPNIPSIPLFKVTVEFINLSVTTSPNEAEIKNALETLKNTIIEASSKFPRWRDGTCICVQKQNSEKLMEKSSNQYTFAEEINKNQVIKDISAEISEAVSNALERMKKYQSKWDIKDEEAAPDDENEGHLESLKKGLFNAKQKSKIDKLLEKNPKTQAFEGFLDANYQFYKEFEASPNEADADFIKIDFTKIKRIFENQAKERIRSIASSLNKIVNREAEELHSSFENFKNEIKVEESKKDGVKKILNTLAKIKDSTEDKEFEIAELIEKCRILKKYQSYGIDLDAKFESYFELGKEWSKLLYRAKLRNDKIKQSLVMFVRQTQNEVTKLQERIDKLHEQYLKTGPSAIETTLSDGLEKMRHFRREIDDLNAARAETVKMQKLFGMEVTSFPKLVEIDEELKKLSDIYNAYSKMRNTIDDLSRKQWDKFDIKELEETKKDYKKFVRDFSKNAQLNTTTVYKKFEQSQVEFEKPLLMIENIKLSPHFRDNHWERLLNSINKPTIGINFLQITLQQVLNLNLHEYPDKVDEVINAANNEFRNKKQLADIEEFWRTANFEISDHKKGGFKVKVSEDIKLHLDEDLNTLQGIESSKFAGTALKQEVKRWSDNLVKVQETIEEWIKVQTKWLYLEGIYIGNEDIRAQLSKETKTFEQHHKTFKNLNEKCSKNANIFANCVLNDTTLNQLQNLALSLDKSQKSLTDYLNSKRKVFPRFYFITNDDLLSILGSSDINSIQTHLIKLFDNVKTLGFEKGKIVQMISEESETFNFFEPYKPEGAVENWMTQVDELMIDTLRKLTKEGVFNFAKMERKDWMAKYISMIVLVTRQIWWTWRVEDVFRKVKEGDKYAMKKEADIQTEELKFLVALVRSDLEGEVDPSGRFRRKINNMIIVDVHARDIVDRFVRDSILDAREFEWESQLRFYWRNNLNDISIEQCTGKFRYGYEYQGLTTRLVITPLTDRCVMTLTTALTFFLGGAPAGPAGTGKTETCKDLGKNLAIRTVVTNCGENFDVLAMATVFSGLCQTGFWGVFDEFNRILPDVLSVISTQIGDIQRTLSQGKATVELLEEEINVRPTVGIFVTMNPGYEGRSELPDNLKALFRPVTMVVPDLKIICENMLMSEGFQEARVLAKKMTVLYQLAKDQLSKQFHYDFQLRALKSVLVMAGALKRGSPELAEEDVLMRALKDMNVPKFVYEDVALFQGLLNDLFPGRVIESVSHKDLKAKVAESQVKMKLQKLEIQVDKVIQLYETMETRHTTMVVGPTGAGKTSIINLLKEARTIPNVRNVVYYIMNPKAQPLLELYGVLDNQTREWKDGILAKTFKFANEELPERGPTDKGPKEELRWILFDGDVDAIWVENMNSVMDDNKLLTLSNGDRIRLKPFCKLLFEVFDLQHASPATISRCGMVYVDPKNLGYEHFYNSWKDKIIQMSEKDKEINENLPGMFDEAFAKYIRPLVDYIFEGKPGEDQGSSAGPAELSVPRTNLNLVQQFTNIMDCLLPTDPALLQTLDSNKFESLFIYACVWSFGSCIKSEKACEGFINYLRTLPTIVLPEKSLYEYVYESGSWIHIRNKVAPYTPREDNDFSKILVPTLDTVKFNYLLNLMMSREKPVMFVGEPGTAKTVIIKNYLASLSIDSFTVLNINFSSRTDSMEVQKNIESVTDKRRPGIYGPKGNKKLIIFVDELHMPIIDPYGTQQPIALLKFLVDKRIMYERGGTLEKRTYNDCQYVTALLPPGGGNNAVDPRFMSLFNCITIQFPKEENIKTIYNSILWEFLKPTFPKEFEDVCKDLTTATYKIFQRIIEALPRSPIKFHYIFNLRDLSRVYQGLLRSKVSIFGTKEKFIRLWRNECTRVFIDRLVSDEDKKVVQQEIIRDAIKETFGEEILKKTAEGDLLYGDFKDSQPLEPDYEDPKLYQPFENYATVRLKCEDLLSQYNEENSEMALVLFSDALEHLIRIIRILRFKSGNCMLVGFGGSGKQSLAKLSSFICSCSLFTIQIKKSYNESVFKKDLLEFYTSTLVNKETVFLFTDTQIIEESFLELINTMLTVGVINNLFDPTEKGKLIGVIGDKFKKSGSTDEMWEFTCDVLRKNLHIALCMSPAGDQLRVRCRNFPGLISNTTIDWFFPWPQEALKNVAEVYLKELAVEKDTMEKIVSHFVYVHMSIPEIARQYEMSTRRKVFNTPKNYLDFLKCYLQSLEKNKRTYNTIIKDYEIGLEKLKQSKGQIEEMRIQIEADKEIVEKRKIEVKKIEVDIKFKQQRANEESEQAKINGINLTKKEIDIKEQKLKAEKLFEQAKPALEDAKDKVRAIKGPALKEAAGFAKPAESVVEVGKLIQILKVNSKCSPGLEWTSCQAVLRETSILTDLVEYKIENCTESQIKRAKGQVDVIKTLLAGKDMVKISVAMNQIFEWAQATLNLYTVFTQIKELENNVEALTAEQKMLTENLIKTKALIEELNANLVELNQKFIANDRELKDLQKKLDEMTNNLNNAIKLLDGLGAEEIRWTKDKEIKGEKIQYLDAECLLCASFLSYYGPFDQDFRKMLTERFKLDLEAKSLRIGEGFRVEDLLTTDVQVTTWNSEGLPGDELSVQNGILTTQSTRYPLCIDPQLQAIKWIKKKEKNILTKYTTNFNDPELIRKLENSFKEADALLIENVGEELDPIIENILLKKYFTQGGVLKVKIGDKDVDVPMMRGEKEFMLYLTTKLPNPSYTPEIMGKTSVINYTVNVNGLAEQLLGEVIKHENPEQEATRNLLITTTSQNLQDLKRYQEKILESLVNSDKDIIKDVKLIETLQTSKTKSKQIEEDLIVATKTKATLEAARLDYLPVAKRGAILFFCMQKMSAISDMYQYSLSSYLEVFKRSLAESMKDDVVMTRIKIIIEKLTQNVYDYITLGIFKNHRRIFTFQMVLMIMEGEGKLNRKELDFFLKGNTKLEDSNAGRIVPWITDSNSKDIENLVEVSEIWKNFSTDLRDREPEWRVWFDREDPEQHPLPSPYDKLVTNRLQLLLILRVLRPDRISLGIDKMIHEFFGSDHFIRVPVLKEKWLLGQSSADIPIIYILSPGADPSAFIRNLATAQGFTGKKYTALSLGRGMEGKVFEDVANAYARGYWVLLQNCDLLPKCIKQLEKRLEGETKKAHEDFRLWMTTQPTTEFPLGILQRALKIVTEPPAGIKNNIDDVINRVNEDQLKLCSHAAYKPLTYVLIFLHAIILDRAKYGKIGWNVTYDFNYSDFQIAFRLLNLYLTKSQDNGEDTVPWDSLKYLIGEAMYGGRVTDDFDRRTLMTYLDEYMGDFLFDKNHEFFFAETYNYKYSLPQFIDKDSLAATQGALPNADSPVVFGLHPNAEITYYTNDAKSLWNNTLKMESVGSSNISPQERDKRLEEICKDLLEKTTFDMEPMVLRSKRLEENKELKPTEVVLFQEMERFKKLSDKIQGSLSNLLKALSGKIGMNAELDNLAASLYNSFLPSSWAKLAPATEKKLGSWVQHFLRRRAQYISWHSNGEPPVMWLSGLQIPESYLTALVQTACRAKGWALDKSTLFTTVTTEVHPDRITKGPDFGCFVTGLFLEGVAWDSQRNCVRAQKPKELIFEMPVMKINPVEVNKLKLKDSMKIPVYVTQNRRNAKGVGHVFDADMNTAEHPSHWVLQGAALVLNTDE